MLKRSKLLVAFLVVTVICASVGFAAVSDSLTAKGKVSVNVDNNTELVEQFDDVVYFSAVTLPSTQTGVTYDGTTPTFTDDDKTDTFSFKIDNTVLTKQGDTTVITATIKNASTVQKVGLTVSAASTVGTTNVADCISITPVLTDKELDANGDTTTLTITVKMDKIPDISFTDTAFTVTVTASPVN